MKGFDFKTRYKAPKKGNGKAIITVKNFSVIMGCGVLPIEQKLEKEQLYIFQAKNLILNLVFNQ